MAARFVRRRRFRTVRSARDGLGRNPAWFERPYQIRFISRVFLIVLTIAVVSACLTIALLWVLLYRPGATPQTQLIAALIGVAVAILIELMLAAPVVYYLGLRQSHQVVGPLRRIIRTLGAIGSGDFSQRIIVRHNDVLGTVANSINRMADRLQKRRST